MSRYFPPIERADEDGLMLIGGRLSPEWLLDAYRHGIFPWPMYDDVRLMAWWSPDPRAVIELDGLYISRRLQRTCRSGKFEITFDRDFDGVIEGCATAQQRADKTWLSLEMIAAYTRLFDLGHVHSVEVWHEGRLAGGVYGVAIGGFFAGESMFHYVRDASKVALVALVERLKESGYELFDVQVRNAHTKSLGAIDIPRSEYLARLAAAASLPVKWAAHSASQGAEG